MNIIVCVKPVPDVAFVSVSDDAPRQIDRNELVFVMNRSDLVAVEQAVRIKEQAKQGCVTLVSVCPPSHDPLLRQCLSLGADEAIRIWEPHFKTADSHVTGVLLASAIAGRKPDMVLFGQKADDTGDGQVGYVVADVLDIPVVTCVTALQVNHKTHTAAVERKFQKGYRERLSVTLPAVIAVEKSLNEPRYASLPDVISGLQKDIPSYGMKALGLTFKQVGKDARRRQLVKVSEPKPRTKKVFTPDHCLSASERMQQIMSGGLTRKQTELFEGAPEVLAEKFFKFLDQHNIKWEALSGSIKHLG